MLLWNLDLLFKEPLLFFLIVAGISFALLIAITLHEFSHALVAHRLGDNTARRLGRLSLNPLVHLDPLGTLMLFVVGIGWGKPVPVNPFSLSRGPKSGMAMVASAGPIANLLTAGLLAAPIKLGLIPWHSPLASYGGGWFFADVIGLIIFYNIILAIFNLIPIAPLDGFKVAVGILPRNLSHSLSRTEQYGSMFLLLVIGFSYFTGLNILWGLLKPAMDFLALLFVGTTF